MRKSGSALAEGHVGIDEEEVAMRQDLDESCERKSEVSAELLRAVKASFGTHPRALAKSTRCVWSI